VFAANVNEDGGDYFENNSKDELAKQNE